MTKQNKASHAGKSSEMPDIPMGELSCPDCDNAGNENLIVDSSYELQASSIRCHDCGLSLSGNVDEEHIKHYWDRLQSQSIPKKDIEGLIANIEDWQVNIGRDAYADNYFNGQMEALRIILKDLQNLLELKGEK